MKTIIITLLNIIALIPLWLLIITGPLVYIMSFDSPVSGYSWNAWLLRIGVFVVFPAVLFLVVYLSQRYQSISIALIGIIPVLYLGYDTFLKPQTSLVEFETASRDYTCADGFLTILEKWFGTPEASMQWVSYNRKLSVNTAREDRVGVIYESYFVPRDTLRYITRPKTSLLQEALDSVATCRNAQGKKFLEVYPLATKEIIEQLNQKIENRNKR